jgi:Fe(3+) dicitrate transport protein
MAISLLVLSLLAGLSVSGVWADDPVVVATIKGQVLDRDTKEPLVGAVVRLEVQGRLLGGQVTDGQGAFRFVGIDSKEEEIEVHASVLGYDDGVEAIDLEPGQIRQVVLTLRTNPIDLAPIQIIGESPRVNRRLTGTAARLQPEIVEMVRPLGTQELLELVPGVNGYADDGFGNSRLSIGIRGLNPRRSSRVLLLEDGVPIQPAVYVYANAYYNPPSERIDAVEVIKGSGAVRYGPQTMGGVINYTTRRPDGSKGLVQQYSAGTNGYYSVFSEWRGLGNEGVRTDVQALYKHGNGFRDNNTFDQANGTVKTQFHLSPRKVLYLKVNANLENSNATYTGLTEYSFRTDPNFNPKKDDDFKVRRAALDLIYTSRITPELIGNTTVYLSVFDRRWWREDDVFVRAGTYDRGELEPVPYFQTGDLVRVGGGTSNFGILRTFYVGGLEQNYAFKHFVAGHPATAEIGARVHWERFIDDKKIGATPRARDGVYFTGTPGDPDDPVQIVGQSHHYQTAALALYARQRVEWGRLTLDPGLRFEVFEQERVDRLRGSVLADKLSGVLLPGLGINFQLGRINLFGGVHRGYTPPSSGALKIANFGQDAAAGGLDLRSEKSWNIEAGLRAGTPEFSMEAAVFWLRIDDLVAAGRGTAFKNLGQAQTYGLELGAALKASYLSTFLPDLNLSYAFLRTRVNSGRVVSGIVAGNVAVDLEGNELPYAPRHTLSLGLAKQVGKRLRVRADMRYVDAVFTDFENVALTFNRGDTGPVPSYAAVNASVDYRLGGRWTVFATAKNLLDKVYIGSRLHSNAGQPQANLSSGIMVGPRRQLNVGFKRGL